jgi:phosphoenolpyruvate phosphomutase-like protein
MTSQDTAVAFRRLHEKGLLVLPNAWDAGSARLIESLGAKAVATTSLPADRSLRPAGRGGDALLPVQQAHGRPLMATRRLHSARSMFPPERMRPTFRPRIASRSLRSAARGAAPAPSARLWVSV